MRLLNISIALLCIWVLLSGCARRVSPVGEVYVTPRAIEEKGEEPTEEKKEERVEIEERERPSAHGYQVQVYAFLNQGYAENARLTLEDQFREKIYVLHISPYYKVRIGDFNTRKEANRVKRKAVDIGYWDAFVVSPSIH